MHTGMLSSIGNKIACNRFSYSVLDSYTDNTSFLNETLMYMGSVDPSVGRLLLKEKITRFLPTYGLEQFQKKERVSCSYLAVKHFSCIIFDLARFYRILSSLSPSVLYS